MKSLKWRALLLLGGLAGPLTAAPPTMGVRLGSATEASIAAYETYAAQKMAPIVMFTPAHNPTSASIRWDPVTNQSVPIDGWEAMSGRFNTGSYPAAKFPHRAGLAWALNEWDADHKPRMVVSIAMLPFNTSGVSLQKGSQGLYDHHWKNIAQTLIEEGYGDNTIRIGWEFMGNWFPWGVTWQGTNGVNNCTYYRDYWKKIVKAMRSVPGANFKFNWCGNTGDLYYGSTKLNPANCYPDDDVDGSYVDEIGFDIYDTHWGIYPANTATLMAMTPNDRYIKQRDAWTSTLSWGTYNLTWWSNFATSKNKPLTIPEWGLAHSTTQHGGGDNALFMQRFHEWLINPVNRVKWHAYFQEDVSFKSKFYNANATLFPNAKKKFEDLYCGRPISIIFQNPVNNVTWTAGWGTRTVTGVGTDGTHTPFEGDRQYKLTYSTAGGHTWGFTAKNLTGASHLSLAMKGPLANNQSIKLRLSDVDYNVGPWVDLPRTTVYDLRDIPLSSLSSGVDMTRVGMITLQFSAPTAGGTETVYFDSISFLKMD